MFIGRLISIVLGPTKGEPVQTVDEAVAIAGRGLEGDRYASKAKRSAHDPSQEVTLIEQEALEAAESDYLLSLAHAESRRNLLTAGVPLNHLVGRTFAVGEVLLEGVELCEPCKHLERLTGKKVVRALLHRGGLRARIVRGGKLQVGDEIRATLPSAEAPSEVEATSESDRGG
jgi:MOSC domain-containing protein YiiM